MKIDITPPTSIYSSFRRYNYTPQGAIAEFVDNSTQSYYDHKEELEDYYRKYFNKDFKLVINILYWNTNGMVNNLDVLKIVDNAYGMNENTFDRAMKLDIKNQKQNSRNEFGLGLKTSAIWFGDLLEVSSVSFVDEMKYETELDVNILKETDTHEISLNKQQSTREKHGTTITIREIVKRFSRKQQQQRLIKELASIYRKEISEGSIQIRFAEFSVREEEWKDASGKTYAKGKDKINFGYLDVPPLEFINPPLLVVPANDPMNLTSTSEEKKNFFSSEVKNQNKNYFIKGWVGILAKGDRDVTGFALLRRGRVIRKNYRPEYIFGKPNGFPSLRVIGEVDLDEFPVIQSKEDFDWNDGLEDAFIDALKQEVAPMIVFANKWRQTEPISKDKLPKKDINDSSQKFVKTMNEEDTSKKDWKIETVSNSEVKYTFVEQGKSKQYNLIFNDNDNPKKWVEIKIENDDSFLVHIYLNHDFLKPYSQKSEFLVFIKRFAEAYSLAYIDSMTNNRDLITFETKFNEYLEELSRKKN